MKNTLKCSVYLLARVILVTMLSFMAIPLSSSAPEILNPILAVFYTFMIIYFFVLTMWHEGGKDSNRVSTGVMNETLYKGFVSAAIVCIPVILLTVFMLLVKNADNPVTNALSIIEVIFVVSVYYAVSLVTPVTAADITEGVVATTADRIPTVIVFCVIYTACIIAAGIGYIVGYKKILIFKPITDKILGRSKRDSI